MTLGRSSTGAIKIKTDGGLRAVNCACCGSPCNCPTRPNPDLRYKFVSTNFAEIVYQDVGEQCFPSSPGEPVLSLFYAFAVLSNGASMSLIWRNCVFGYFIKWEITLIGSSPDYCSNLLAISFSDDPSGTRYFDGAGDCDGWAVTIGVDDAV